MHIKIISLNKIKQKFILAGEAEYLPRLREFCKLSLVELNPQMKGSPAEVMEKEGKLLLESLNPGEYFVALDETGKSITSPDFAAHIERLMIQGRSNFVFAIGGAHGLSEEIRKRADLILSLSNLTFPYQLSRLILVEQIYRALSIIRKLPYHK